MIRLVSAAAAALLAALLAATSAQAADPVTVRVERVLRATPVIDGHNDLPWELRTRVGGKVFSGGVDLSRNVGRQPVGAAGLPSLMTDIPRLRAGHVGAQFWSVWIPAETTGAPAVLTTIEQIDTVKRLVARYPQDLALAWSAADVERSERAGRIASLIGVEGGHQIANSLAVLRAYRDLGVRYMTLAHFKTNDFADSATDVPRHGGLSPFGRAVVGEMNRLGMLVDLSHVSAGTMRAALTVAQAPVIFSHSSAQAIGEHPRDVPDDVLRLVRANRGVVMVNFYPAFVSPARWHWNADRDGEKARLRTLFPGDPDAAKAGLARWEAAHPRPAVTLAMVADHVDHIAAVCGHDCVGIGSDFDGIDEVPQGLEDVSTYPRLFEELARRGWSDDDLAKLAGGNILRVMREAEAVATRLQQKGPPSEAEIAAQDGPR